MTGPVEDIGNWGLGRGRGRGEGEGGGKGGDGAHKQRSILILTQTVLRIARAFTHAAL